MSGEIVIKAPVAAVFILVLFVSVLVNVWKFSQPPRVIQIAPPNNAASTLPDGTADPLSHVPRNAEDAVGMPDATGGRETMGQQGFGQY